MSNYTWMNDPNSTIDFSPNFGGTTTGPDTTTYGDFLAVNTNGQPEADVGLWLPFVEVMPPGGSSFEALKWNNDQGGWFTGNFIDASGHKTGESLLLTAQIEAGSSQTTLAAGNVAASGTEQYPLSTTALGITSLPEETIQKGDLLPFANIGSLGADGSKSFEISFTAHWGGADLGPVQTAGYVATLVPDQTGHMG